MRPVWMEDAACVEADPVMFFPDRSGSARAAKRLCGTCPVRDECLEYALATDAKFGVWGGLSERQRARLQSRRAA